MNNENLYDIFFRHGGDSFIINNFSKDHLLRIFRITNHLWLDFYPSTILVDSFHEEWFSSSYSMIMSCKSVKVFVGRQASKMFIS